MPRVLIKQGELRGSIGMLYNGSTYYSFKGIPYAQPPVGALRFRSPLPPLPWIGVYDATLLGNTCTQIVSFGVQKAGNEDCLFLNVYTPSLEPTSKLPVMVFIHGGAFRTGANYEDIYGPKFLLEHNVILVTINYRLEALGFLTLDTPEVPGNAGMKDQVAALRWVQENIAQFGGDPNNVLIFGESAGGASVTYHLLSPMSRGLFQKAIAQSGVCISKWATGYDGMAKAFRLGKLLGKETDDVDELLEFLRSVPAFAITNVTIQVQADNELELVSYGPCKEKKFENVEQFLTESPKDILLAKQMNEVPMIIGYNSKEGYVSLTETLKFVDVYNKYVSKLIPIDMAQNLSADEMNKFGERIKQFYVGNGTFGVETLDSLADYLGDSYFIASIQRFANYYKKFQKTSQPIYMYKFCCDAELNIGKLFLGLESLKGASHTDDLYYIFNNPSNEYSYISGKESRYLIDRMTTLWTNFAKTGNPTPDDQLGVQWPPYTLEKKEYLNIDRNLTVQSSADKERMMFWSQLYCDAKFMCVT